MNNVLMYGGNDCRCYYRISVVINGLLKELKYDIQF